MPEIAQAISIKHFVTGIDPTSLEGSERSLTDALFERLTRLRAEAEELALRDRKSLVKGLPDPVLAGVARAPPGHHLQPLPVQQHLWGNHAFAVQGSGRLRGVGRRLRRTRLYFSGEVARGPAPASAAGTQDHAPAASCVRTISNATTTAEYVRLLEAVPEAYRKFIILEITGAGWHHPPSHLGRLASLLARYSRHVAVELSLDDPRVGAVAAEPVWAVTLNLAGADTADPRLMPQLHNFANAVSAMAVNSIARGATSIGLALAAAELGFTYVDGPGVHLPVREPKVPARLRPVLLSTVTGPRAAQPQARSRASRRNPTA